jgi:hypothetical protein
VCLNYKYKETQTKENKMKKQYIEANINRLNAEINWVTQSLALALASKDANAEEYWAHLLDSKYLELNQNYALLNSAA